MEQNYIKATVELLERDMDIEQVLSELKKVLQKHGHTKLHKKILIGLLNHIEKTDQAMQSVVTVARERDLKTYKQAIETDLKELGGEAYIETVDDSLIGGVKVERGGYRIDRSYKTQLVNLYRSIITS